MSITVWHDGSGVLVDEWAARGLGLKHGDRVDWETCRKIFEANLRAIQEDLRQSEAPS